MGVQRRRNLAIIRSRIPESRISPGAYREPKFPHNASNEVTMPTGAAVDGSDRGRTKLSLENLRTSPTEPLDRPPSYFRTPMGEVCCLETSRPEQHHRPEPLPRLCKPSAAERPSLLRRRRRRTHTSKTPVRITTATASRSRDGGRPCRRHHPPPGLYPMNLRRR
jgi:hypothetical protein